jgi:hypothetical protein
MRYYDVFNGDADGICALHQLRLADPLESELVTGLKRDIELLKAVPAARGDVVTVLDISLDRNRGALAALLARGAHVRYFDHHHAGEVPVHAGLEAVIDESDTTCTSALVDRHLMGRFRAWAVVGAFGDNLHEVATMLAAPLALDAGRLDTLAELGASINYNAYGASEADLLFRPEALYRIVSGYGDPFEMAQREPAVERLAVQRRADLEKALATRPVRSMHAADAYVLPDAPWSRRVSGTFANRLATEDPRRAHAVLTPLAGDTFTVSVRAPRACAPTAAEFCRRYGMGGGRVAAGGIERLEAARLDAFLDDLGRAWARFSSME